MVEMYMKMEEEDLRKVVSSKSNLRDWDARLPPFSIPL
jgi:hypothetical protein